MMSHHADAVEFNAGEFRAVAADADAGAFAEVVALERRAGHAADGFVDVAVGEGADVVSDDRVGRRGGAALAVDGGLLAGAGADDDDVGDGAAARLGGVFRRGARLRHGGRADHGDAKRQPRRRRDRAATSTGGCTYHYFFSCSKPRLPLRATLPVEAQRPSKTKARAPQRQLSLKLAG